MKSKTFRLCYIYPAFIFSTMVLLLSSCKEESAKPATPTESIYALIETNPELSLTASYIELGAVLVDGLDRNTEDWTYFAPTNDAWVAFMDFYDIRLLNKPFLLNLVAHHAIPDSKLRKEALDTSMVTLWSRDFNPLATIQVEEGRLYPALDNQQARILTPDSLASNGILHLIDKVLLPSFLIDMKGTNAEMICLNHEFEFFYKGIMGSELFIFNQGGISFLELLAGETEHTVFASMDDVFRANNTDETVYSESQWYSVLGKRFILEAIEPADLVNGATFTTVSGAVMNVFVNPDGNNGIYLDWNGDFDPENPDIGRLDGKLKTVIPRSTDNGKTYFLETL